MVPFAESFAGADEVLVAPVFAARERESSATHELSSELSRRINAAGVRARFLPSLDRIVATLDHDLRPGDVLITLGAGDIGQVHHAFHRRLSRHHPA
jgi:UDP-N-acetylmuramate--alanine ligase